MAAECESELTDFGEFFPECGRVPCGNGSCEKLRLTEDELGAEQEKTGGSGEDHDGDKDGRNRGDEEEEGRRKDDGRRVRCLKTVTRRTRHSSTCRTADGRTSGKIYTAKQRHIKMVLSDDGCRDEERGGRKSKSRRARSGSESAAENSYRRSSSRKKTRSRSGSQRRSNDEHKRSSRRSGSSGGHKHSGKASHRTTPSKSTRARSIEGSDVGEGGRSNRYSNSSRTRSSYEKGPSSHGRSKSRSSHSRRSSRKSAYNNYDEVSAGTAGSNKPSWRRRALPEEESFDPRKSSYSGKAWDHDWEYDQEEEEEDVLSDIESDDPSTSQRSQSRRRSSHSRKSSYPSASAASEDERRSEVYKGDASRYKKARKKSSRSRRRCWDEESLSRRGRKSICEHFHPCLMPPPPVYNPYFSYCYPPMEECGGEMRIFYPPPPYPVVSPYHCRHRPALSSHSYSGRSRRKKSASRKKTRSCPSE